MNCEFFSGYTLDDFHMLPYFAFSGNNRGFMINPQNGTTLLVSGKELQKIADGVLSEHMKYKMVSLGFAVSGVSPQVLDGRGRIYPCFFMIDMTNGCNLACKYCLRVPPEMQRSISEEKLMDICRFIAETCGRHKINEFTIQPWGGEPLLQINKIAKIREYFRQYPQFKVKISVQTNGTLLTEKNLRVIRDNEIEFGVSEDGPSTIHDKQRLTNGNLPTAGLVKERIKMAHKYGFNSIGAIGVLTNKSVGRIREIYDYSRNELNLNIVKLNLMHQPSHDCGDLRALTDHEIEDVCREIVDYYFESVQSDPDFKEPNIVDRINNLLYRSNSNICHSCGCCGGRRMVSFDMDGNIYPCELTDWADEIIGNIYSGEDLLDMIAYGIKTKAYFNERKNDGCDHCPWYYYCRGGCSAAVKYRNGNRSSIDEMECRYNKTVYPLIVEHILNNPEDQKDGELIP